MNEAPKLQIRINFTSQPPTANREERAYIYHWHRIIGASLFAVMTLSLLGYSLFGSSNQPEAATQNTALAGQATATSSAEKRTSHAPQDNSAVAPASKNNAKQTPITVKTESLPTKAALPTPAAPALFIQAKSERFSEQIKRFVFAKAVKEREPVGKLSDIEFDANNLATVYAYSHAVGLIGETLYYKWRLNGKQVAQVKTKVSAERWRSYSRKFIQPHMQGEWEVVLEDKNGEILAISQFSFEQE